MKWLSDNSGFLSNHKYQDTTLLQWIVLALLTLALYHLFKFLFTKGRDKLKIRSEATATKFDDIIYRVIRDVGRVFLFSLSLFVAAIFVDTSDQLMLGIKKLLTISAFYQIGIWGAEIVSFYLKKYLLKRSGLSDDKDFNLSTYSAINLTAKFLMWVIIFLMLLDNLGVNITALVTGLGIGGIAIALAVQNILGDIFASLTIVLDQPFQVGDYIVVGDKSGTVEAVGLKTSRVRSVTGEELVFPNKKLIESEIKNFKRLQKRTITFNFSIHFDTKTSVLRKIPGVVKKIIESKKDVIFDRAHFKEYGKESLDFEVVYSINSSSYDYYMDVQQEINLELLDEVRRIGGKFSFQKTLEFTKSEDDEDEKHIKDGESEFTHPSKNKDNVKADNDQK